MTPRWSQRLSIAFALCIILFASFSNAWSNQRPVIEVRDGNLFITSALDRNITLQTLGASSVNINGINVLQVASSARDASQLVERWRAGALVDIENTLSRLVATVEGRFGLLTRVNNLEFGTSSNTTATGSDARPNGRLGPGNDAVARRRIDRLTARVRQAETRIALLFRKMQTDECASNPCQNGGTCEDMIDAYKCRCTEGWEGPRCNVDINECSRWQGTDLGCQNGATCLNLPGTYHCACKQGWYGIHCTQQLNNCSNQNSHELCGHGVCVNKPNSNPSYACICDQGWKSDVGNPACTKDVDECSENHPPCSVNPMVPCINLPGTFYCGACPQGYTGNGYYCSDIDECAVNNGGCSTSPTVQCINTLGSRICGSCPAGYQGDGVTCTYVGSCRINNGGCHYLATCTNIPGMSDSYVQCRCPVGYIGDGLGPNGCQINLNPTISACSSNPCGHGTCILEGLFGYTCRCNAGYTGRNCEVRTNPCDPNPCKNQGTCSVSAENGAVCTCKSGFTGSRCGKQRASCGEVINQSEGSLQFPSSGSNYPPGLSCAWVFATNSSMVLNITFTAFNLEQSQDCEYDFVQIHDGPTAGEQLIGRYCGDKLPHGGNIISSINALYLWFHSDKSINRDGFALEWHSIAPQCGGDIIADHGSVSSPGSPGKYPRDRDCIWHISVTPGRRIQFHFFTVMFEEHPTCAYDYLEIKDGPSLGDQQLGIYCNHTHPPPLITSEDEVWVHFHSDHRGQDFGFQMTFSSIEGSPGCGGVYTANSGSITSPNFHDEGYDSLLNCEWKIQIPIGERIQITWITFELERSRNCMFDSVEVFDGGNREAPLIGRYCGTTLPATILSTSNILLIRFKSDWTLSEKGFRLNYEVWCGGEFTEATGVVKSPYYPNPYPASRVCIYKIIQPPGKAIELTFQDMDIEGLDYPDCYYDYLEVHDGDNENSTTIGTYCGTNSSIPEFPILSTHNYLWLKFATDFSTQKHGFLATYTTVDRRCGGILKGTSGVIQTPSDNGRYGNGENCTWIIQAPPGFVIQLNWLTFDLESHSSCNFDYIEISENLTSTSRQDLGKYCGSTKPPTITSQSQIMSVKFHSDDSLSREGFMASYIFVDASKMCGGYFSALTGLIKSPNYPESYPTNRECEWVINAPNKHQVVLTVKKFDIESQSTCSFDYLEIRTGGLETSPLIGKFCGTEIPTQLKSFGSQIYLKFKSDVSRSGEGFAIEWDSSTVGCGGTSTTASGAISSPGYPQPYDHRAECNWRIKVAAGSVIQFVIVDLDLEEHQRCQYDFVEIFEGYTRGRQLGKYCGSNHPLQIETTSNVANIHFRTDWSGSGRGFHMNYRSVCNHKHHTFRGVIESPNFPNNYPDHANCTWIIDAPIGNKLNITFSHFDLEEGYDDSCSYDYLKISEGTDDTPNREIGTFCGSNVLPHKIVSTEHQVFVHLQSDSYTAFNGFRLEWVVNGCGGLLTRPDGTITSPGYPNPYSDGVDCEWNIEVDQMHSIELTLHDVQLEKTPQCSFDRLSIYSGEDDAAPKLIETCHVDATKPVVVTSTSHRLFIKFHSDYSFPSVGFKATYKSVNIKCGGRFIAPTGLIQSPNYPMNYPKNQMCEWYIRVADNHLVNLTFVDFDIENTRNCTDDYVRIYDGSAQDAPLLGSHCHNTLPPSYLSTGNELLVVMRTDAYVTAKGFKATYDLACGARIVASDQGIISMDSAVGLHTEITNCTWIIIAEDLADHVTFTLTDMQLSSTSDESQHLCYESSVQIFEGEGTDGPSLGTWCNTTVPPPVTSQGNALTIHATMLYGGLYDVRFSGTYSVINSACGGNYTAEHGTIATPGYPGNYPRNIQCVWYLQTSPGNSISLNFREFDVIQSDNCDLDFAEVREENGAGKLIGVYCGQNVNQITSQKSLWIKFRSSADGTGKGFLADYSLKHGNDLSGITGEIASPLYPKPCLLEGEYHWRILADITSSIQITFKEFYLAGFSDECYSSTITIYDGFNEEAPQLLSKCGMLIPETIRSSSNIVYIKFTSHSYGHGSWFLLSWLQVPRVSGAGAMITSNEECDEVISLTGPDNTSYTFNSPGWPILYDDNLNCRWTFESVPGTHLVLKFNSLDLEESMNCIMDHVKVYSPNYSPVRGDSGGWSEIGSFCYSNSTSLNNIAGSNIMRVNFKTDYAIHKTGFNATVRKVCGGELHGPNGIIEFNSTTKISGSTRLSVGTCQWNVTVRPGRMIEVRFLKLDIQSTSEAPCGDYYLMLKNGGSAWSPVLGNGKYCRNEMPEPLQTTGNQLYVKVYGLRSSTEFKFSYREVSMDCGQPIVLTEELKSWELSTPNYPNIPSPHSECIWTVIAPAGEEISIDFIDRFDLTTTRECDAEYVEIRDGGTESSRLINRYCGSQAPSTIHTTGNVMYIHFYTEVHDPKNGFKALVQIGKQCGGILRGTEGMLRSPNYPEPYPSNISCTWNIVGPPGHTIKLQFQDIELPNRVRCETSDYVEISEQVPSNSTMDYDYDETSSYFATHTIGAYCGSTLPGVIETSNNEAVVGFKSTSGTSSSYKGFSVNFTTSLELCGGSLDGVAGEFSSPGYPNVGSTHHRYCEWQITAPEGYRIKLEILDVDLGAASPGGITRLSPRIILYNDMAYDSMIKRIWAADTERQFFSTSNVMYIWYWSGTSSQRGFKARYSRVSPSLCGSVLTSDQGTLLSHESPAFNVSTFYCQWKANNPSNNLTSYTLALTASGAIAPNPRARSIRSCPMFPSNILLIGDTETIACISGNLTSEVTVLSIALSNTITASRGLQVAPGAPFNLKYRWNQCGGILGGSSTISAPTNLQYPIDCAWHAKFPDNGGNIILSFKKLNLASCSGNYIIIRNGGPLSPQIDKYCGSITPANVISQSNQLWIQYHAENQNNEFEIQLNANQGGCGGIIQGIQSSDISSPGFPQQYPANAECLWEIVVDNGYHIGLTFVDRFHLETSANCANDFVQVFDWREDANTGIVSWFDMGKVCGRDTPKPFNSTGNRMKILFRSNEATEGDGFHAIWNENCGGIIQVSKRTKYLSSPGWPIAYGGNLFCNYTFLAPGKEFIVEFVDFKLERGREDCRFDNVSIISRYGDDMSTWCSTDPPPVQRVESRLEVLFKTDAYTQYEGFRIKYSLDECGGEINEPADLKSPSLDSTGDYYPRINCTWIVRAPPGKAIVLRFESFHLEYSVKCYFDFIAVYSGLTIDSEKRLALLCGRLNESLPIIRSEDGTMTVNFVTDSSFNFGGFAAKVVFTSGPGEGCGGDILLSQSQTFRTQRNSMYESLEDCHWLIRAPNNSAIRLQINSMDLKNAISSSHSNQAAACSGDYLEIRDGAGPFSELVGKFCGDVVPPPISSSSNKMWIRFVTDGTINGRGVTATLDIIPSPCGNPILVIGNQTGVLTSPRYPRSYPIGIRCRWALSQADSDRHWRRITIHFVEFDLGDSSNCSEDVLSISDRSNRNYISEGLGQDLIFSGTQDRSSSVWRSVPLPQTTYLYCGSGTPHDYYSGADELEIQFKSSSNSTGLHSGFKLEYGGSSCNRNFTGLQGRIIHEYSANCSFTITAAVGYTISLYFDDFLSYDYGDCLTGGLEIHEGDFSGSSLARLCGSTIPNPIFSSANKLSLHSWTLSGNSFDSYDITYTTTDKGRGCGGKLYNYGGVFTSPLYPGPYRNASECTWEVSVPIGSVVQLEFSTFDLGSKQSCGTDFIEISDVQANGDTVPATTYCGEDRPAKYHSQYGKVLVKYHTTVNNGGTGWVLRFTAQRHV